MIANPTFRVRTVSSLPATGNVGDVLFLTSGNIGFYVCTATDTWTAQLEGAVRQATLFAGADAGAKITAAIADLPSTGGTVDARGFEGAQTITTNPFASVTKAVMLLIGGATFTTSAPIVLNNRQIIRGLGRDQSIIKAAGGISAHTNSDTNSRIAVIVLGPDDANVFACRVEDLVIDCSDVVSSIGVYTESANELSGAIRVEVINSPWRGFEVEDTAAGTPQNFVFENVAATMSDLPDLQAGSIGFDIQGSVSHRGINGITTLVSDAGGGGTLTAGIRLNSAPGLYSRLHVEDATDGVLVGNVAGSSGIVIVGITDGPGITTVVRLQNGSEVAVFAVVNGSSTNALVDEAQNVTITSASLASYQSGVIHYGDNVNLTYDGDRAIFFNTGAGVESGRIRDQSAGGIVISSTSDDILLRPAGTSSTSGQAQLTTGGAWRPGATGQDLGSTSLRWDAFLETTQIFGDINHDGTNIGFFSVAPVNRPDATEDIKDALTTLGLLQGTSASPLDLDGGEATAGRYKAEGAALVAGDFSLSGGWGTTASVGTITGTDQRCRFTVTSSGTGQAANPTITLTFTDGTWTTAPFAVVGRAGGSQLAIIDTWTKTATTLVITFNGTPVDTETYIYEILIIG